MKIRTITTLLLLLLLITACKEEAQKQEAENIEPERVLTLEDIQTNDFVELGNLQTRKIEQKVNCTGQFTLLPNALASVHSKIDGSLQSIRYLPGDYVAKGTVLAWIQNQELIEKQKNYLVNKQQLLLAEAEYDRKNKLFSEKVVSEKEQLVALTERNILKATLTALKKELSLLGINLEELEKEQKFQDRVPVFSPIAGWVQEVDVHKGQWIEKSQPLMMIANTHQMSLRLDVLARDASLIKKGQSVEISLPANKLNLLATVANINPSFDKEQGSLPVFCKLEKEASTVVSPGMFVNAIIHVGEKEVTGLPLDAVIKEGENYFAFIVKNKALSKMAIQDPIILDDFIIIHEKIENQVVVKGAYYVE